MSSPAGAAGKKLVDGHYQNQITPSTATSGNCWRGQNRCGADRDRGSLAFPASIMAARAGKDVYSEKPCGLTIADCQALADTMNHFGRVFQAGTQRAASPIFSSPYSLPIAASSANCTRSMLRLHARQRLRLATRGTGTLPRSGGLGPLAGPRALAPLQSFLCSRRLARILRFRLGCPVAGLGYTVDLCQWANQADDTMPIEYEPTPISS